MIKGFSLMLIRYIRSFFVDEREHGTAQCVMCPVNRRKVTAKEARAMLHNATERFADTVTLHPEQVKALLEKVHKQ